MKKILLTLACIALSAATFGAELYVSQANGKKKGPGTKEAPFKAITDAIKKAAPGDTIYMAEGNYSGLLGASEIIIDKPVTIIGGFSADFATRDLAAHTTKIQPPNDKNDSKGIGVNLDPANLIMVQNDDPVKAVYALRDFIVHTHAKDGVQYKPCDPVKVYNAFAEGGVEGLNIGELFNELPLGEGRVDWDRYLAALSEVGYRGYLTVEREVGANPEADIRTAVNFLKARI